MNTSEMMYKQMKSPLASQIQSVDKSQNEERSDISCTKESDDCFSGMAFVVRRLALPDWVRFGSTSDVIADEQLITRWNRRR